MERVTADASTLSLLPLEDVDSMLQRATVDGALAVQLPKHFKCRLKDIRTQCGGGQRPAEFKFDVAECWMAYFPGNFAQAWGYRRALMGEMQDQPLLVLSRENFPSLEFAEEIPTRSSVRRLEFVDEQRNEGAARRIYRPMMCAQDLLRFLASDFARRGVVKSSAGGESTARPRAVEGRAATEQPVSARHAQVVAAYESERKKLDHLKKRIMTLQEEWSDGTHVAKRRRLLQQETEFAIKETLLEAYGFLLQNICALPD